VARTLNLWQTAEDGGKTWEIAFDGRYVREKPWAPTRRKLVGPWALGASEVIEVAALALVRGARP